MSKDRSERRAYRKSPGRQYGYDYDPLHSSNRANQSQSGRSRPSTPGEQQVDSYGKTTRHLTGYAEHDFPLAPRPDPRRTRQLLRQHIIASKSKTALYGEQEAEEHTFIEEGQPHYEDQQHYDEQDQSASYGYRSPRGNTPARTSSPAPRRTTELDREAEEAQWEELGYVEPELGEDPLTQRVRHSESMSLQPARRPSGAGRNVRRYEPGEDDYDYEEEERYRRAERRKARKRAITRRRLLIGIGAVAAGGAAVAVAAIELPKVPQAINSAGQNIERQLEDSFNKGFQAGADAVRKEFITALNNLEGISLDAATAAAKLTRVAYDVFVSPIVTFLANLADDFLTLTLRALITGRHWLHNIGQDNDTLAALQNVLQSWVQDAQQMPKQIQSIADADLDGAQAYLRALRRKIDTEQAKLNQPNPTPTPAPKR